MKNVSAHANISQQLTVFLVDPETMFYLVMHRCEIYSAHIYMCVILIEYPTNLCRFYLSF